MSDKKSELKREYKLNPRPMGVYQIRNVINEKVLMGAANDLPGVLNRHKFQLKMGNHPNAALQADWNELGAEGFAFEILDEITPKEGRDDRKELAFLEELWLEKSQPYGARGYNEKKKGEEEMLRLIAQNRMGRE
ncbi:MAG: GIY-YIG nuclease family protein [Chloracidobacterium sp.]|nr:GIY-YIG nuclease family protein [Chloracidobacterium sp.]